ncbi:MAG: hypothetical protein HY791_04600 [Deltaproteobacteria bacterium]|nr:hypothetical protein [Deltaproteobacteria bacterium]
MLFDEKRGLLSSLGFEVTTRTNGWTDCLVAGLGEAHLGHGRTPDAALDDAIARALPSALARRLFEEVASGRREKRAQETRATAPAPIAMPIATPVAERTVGQIAVIVSRPANAPPLPTQPIAARGIKAEDAIDAAVTPSASPPADDARPPLVARPEPPASAPAPAPVAADTPAAVDNAHAPDQKVRTVDDSLEELDILFDRIRDHREELGLTSPERQRMAILAWISEARSHADAFPDDLRIRDRVGAISRALTEIGKTFWPGSVTALQLHMQPRELPRHLLGGVATTWHRAAELAETALRNRELEDERRGYDAYGWADSTRLAPQPLLADRLLEAVIAEVESFSGPLEIQAGPSDPMSRPEPSQFQRWVRLSRWLRGSDANPDRWARLVGRLRWWAFRRDPALNPIARELEPSYSPSSPWAALLGFDAERQARDRELRDAFSASPQKGADPQALAAFIKRAIVYADTHHGNIVRALAPNAAAAIAIGLEALGLDPKYARRWKAIEDDLVDAKLPAPSPIPDESNPMELVGNGSGESLPPSILEVIRGRTEGKKAVLVGLRRDPELIARLQDAFRFAGIDTKIAEPRRVEALSEAIHSGSYDYVFGATGLQTQGTDVALARACREAGVRYVRVNRARPIVCLRALVRAS